jgi:hypothetical protein
VTRQVHDDSERNGFAGIEIVDATAVAVGARNLITRELIKGELPK